MLRHIFSTSLAYEKPRGRWVASIAFSLLSLLNLHSLHQALHIATCFVQEYDVKNFYKETGWAQWLARHTWFENTTMAIIVSWTVR